MKHLEVTKVQTRQKFQISSYKVLEHNESSAKEVKEFLFKWSHHGISSTDSKFRTTQGQI